MLKDTAAAGVGIATGTLIHVNGDLDVMISIFMGVAAVAATRTSLEYFIPTKISKAPSAPSPGQSPSVPAP